MELRITEVTSASQRRLFEQVAEDLHGAIPNFVPPFPGSVAGFLKPDSVFHRLHGKIAAFIAWHDGRPVGRVAAILNERHNRHYGDTTGFFGFFECIDDETVARALLDRAAAFLTEAGRASMRGPYNPSINDECGLLVEGFERQPCIGLTWNPPYYARLVQAAGLQPVRSSLGYRLPLASLEPNPRVVRLAKRVEQRTKMRLRPIDMKALPRDLAVVQEVYNDTLSRNWGFVPIQLDDLLAAAGDLRAIADPEMILIAERDGEPAGVALSLPNFNELLHALKRTPRWLRLPHLLWLMKTRRPKRGRFVVYGILPKFRDLGLHPWLLHEQFLRAKRRYEEADLGWVEENNTEIIASAHLMGAIDCQRWQIFEKAL